MAVNGLDHLQIAIPRNGEELARKFYGELLGLQEIAKPESLTTRGGLWFQCGPVQFHLGIDEDFRAAKRAHPAFIVDALTETVSTLRSAGFQVGDVEVLGDVERVFTHDPFGNRVELVQPIRITSDLGDEHQFHGCSPFLRSAMCKPVRITSGTHSVSRSISSLAILRSMVG